MGTKGPNGRKSPLPPFEEFQQKFREAFGREMTREERRFYRLANIVLDEDSPQAPAPTLYRQFRKINE